MRLLTFVALLIVIAGQGVSSATTGDQFWGNNQDGRDEIRSEADVADAAVQLDVRVDVPGTPGSGGTVDQAADEIEAAPEGHWIAISGMVFATDPPCVRTVGEFLEGVSAEEAARIEQDLENRFVVEYEAYISTAPPPPPCPDSEGDGTPGIDPTEAEQFADSAAERLPVAAPVISGGKAITGLRSWLDLGRDSTFTVDKSLDLGPDSRTATMTATAVTTVDWGDGTVTTHASRGGGYHAGEPGPDDITHTYTHAADGNVLTVSDTWDIVVTVPGLQPITLTWSAPPVTMTFDIDEVRSSRDR